MSSTGTNIINTSGLSVPPDSLSDCTINAPLVICCAPDGFRLVGCTVDGHRGSTICCRHLSEASWPGSPDEIRACTIVDSIIFPHGHIQGGVLEDVTHADIHDYSPQLRQEYTVSKGPDIAARLLKHTPKDRGNGSGESTYYEVRQKIAQGYDPAIEPAESLFFCDTEPGTGSDCAESGAKEVRRDKGDYAQSAGSGVNSSSRRSNKVTVEDATDED